jgi:hypothetical protein
VQCLAPALVSLGYGLASLAVALERWAMPAGGAAAGLGQTDATHGDAGGGPIVFWEAALGFSAWWAACSWFCCTAATLWMLQAGLLSS